MVWFLAFNPEYYKDTYYDHGKGHPQGTRQQWEQKRDAAYASAGIGAVSMLKDTTSTDTALSATAVATDVIQAQGANQAAHRFKESESGQSNKNN